MREARSARLRLQNRFGERPADTSANPPLRRPPLPQLGAACLGTSLLAVSLASGALRTSRCSAGCRPRPSVCRAAYVYSAALFAFLVALALVAALCAATIAAVGAKAAEVVANYGATLTSQARSNAPNGRVPRIARRGALESLALTRSARRRDTAAQVATIGNSLATRAAPFASALGGGGGVGGAAPPPSVTCPVECFDAARYRACPAPLRRPRIATHTLQLAAFVTVHHRLTPRG